MIGPPGQKAELEIIGIGCIHSSTGDSRRGGKKGFRHGVWIQVRNRVVSCRQRGYSSTIIFYSLIEIPLQDGNGAYILARRTLVIHSLLLR